MLVPWGFLIAKEGQLAFLKCWLTRFSSLSPFQVAIKAGLFSLPFSLEVFSPRAAIVGGSEFHLDRGSTISLSCVVRQATEQTQ